MRTLLALLLLLTPVACGGACGGEPSPPPETPTPTEELGVPDDYLGPIDPEWPPSHPTDQAVELRAGAMLLEQLARGGDGDTDEPLIEGDVPDVFAHQGHIGDFDYIEAILGEVDSIDEELPLVVLLHGRGGRPSIPHRGMAGEPAVRLFIPRAPDRLGDHGFTWLATWTTSGNTELLARSLAGRVDELMPAIEAFIALRPTRGKPVVAGFSQGAIMTYGLVTRYPQKFAAGFPIAGWLPEQMLPEAPQADVTYPLIRAMHGTADETVPFDFGRQTYQSLRGLGYPVEWTEVPGVAHETTPEMGQQVRGWIGQVLFPEAQPQTVTQDTP